MTSEGILPTVEELAANLSTIHTNYYLVRARRVHSAAYTTIVT